MLKFLQSAQIEFIVNTQHFQSVYAPILYELTNEATDRARKSFEMWKEFNNLK